MTELPVYVPSGRISGRAWLWFALVGTLAAILIGWAYANALALVTWKPAAIFPALVLWATFVLLMSSLAKRSHSRSPQFNSWVGALIALLALWAHWVVYVKISGGSPLAAEFAQSGPLGWLAILGRWAVARSEAGGTSAWLSGALWLAEAAITTAVASGIASGVAREPYSEEKFAWARSIFKGELISLGASSAAFAESLPSHGISKLLALEPASTIVGEAVAAQWWTVEIEGVAVMEDPSARWLNVTLLIQTRDGRGGVKVAREGVVKAWHVGDEDFDTLKRRLNPADVAGPRETPAALEPAVAALERGEFASAFAAAQALVGEPNAATRADALRLSALAASRMSKWDVAFSQYEALFDLEPTAFTALQLATTSVCGGQLVRGQQWLPKAHEMNSQTEEMQPPRIDTAFLSALEQGGEFAAARPLLDKLADIYRSLPTLDDHFVWSHGLPFFGEFVRRSVPLLRRSESEQEVEAWCAHLRQGLDEEGIATVDRALAELRQAGD